MIELSGKILSSKIKEDLSKNIKEKVDEGHRPPCLVTILVGNDPASKVYVANKEKACNAVGINNITKVLPEDTIEEELIDLIQCYNWNLEVDGILVQLPLPKHIDSKKVLKAIWPSKDVDGFHPNNVAGLWSGTEHVAPCTPSGIMKLIDDTGINLEGKHVVVIGRSNIVGLPVAKMCLDRNATVSICHSKTKDLREITSQADVLIVAIGKPNFIKNMHLKIGAIVIDVGINRVDGKLYGDVDYESIGLKASYATPVPGGVGPMTIACLLTNTYECYVRNETIYKGRNLGQLV